MTTQHDQDKAAFEKWASDGGKWPSAIVRGAGGTYRLMQTASAWSVWQAARADLREQHAQALKDAPILGYRIGTQIFTLQADAMSAQRYGPDEGKLIVPLKSAMQADKAKRE